MSNPTGQSAEYHAVNVPAELKAALIAQAEACGCKLSAYLRAVLRDVLKEEGGDASAMSLPLYGRPKRVPALWAALSVSGASVDRVIQWAHTEDEAKKAADAAMARRTHTACVLRVTWVGTRLETQWAKIDQEEELAGGAPS